MNESTLEIRRREGYNLKPTQCIKVYVSGPSFKHFEASGACDIHTEARITSADAIIH